jgi:hypothetical protein
MFDKKTKKIKKIKIKIRKKISNKKKYKSFEKKPKLWFKAEKLLFCSLTLFKLNGIIKSVYVFILKVNSYKWIVPLVI